MFSNNFTRLSTTLAQMLPYTRHTTYQFCFRLFNNTIKTKNNTYSKTLFKKPLSFSKFSCNYSDQKKAEFITLHFKLPNGKMKSTKAKVGKNLLDVVLDNNLDIDGFGACEGTLACSTCHVVFSQQHFDLLPSSPCDEELDMLDLAYSLTDTSRLGCQVIVKKQMDGWEIVVPTSVDAR